MRIVCAVHDYPPNRTVGSARIAQQLCRELADRGHEVVVVTSARPRVATPDGADDAIVVDQIRRGPVNGWGRHVRHRLRRVLGEDDFGLARPLCGVIQQRIRRARPDLVLALAVSTQEVVAAAQTIRRQRLPGVVLPFYHIHAPDFVEHPERWFEVLRSFSAVVTLTREEAAFLDENGVPASRIERTALFVEAPPPVPPEEVLRWRRERNLGDRLLVVAGGSYSPTKGIWALARASRVLPDVRFVFFGGDERARRRLEAAVPVGGNVEFAGVVDEQEKSRLLHAADLLAMPSRGDAFGLLYIEANACGTPGLAADLDSMREVLGPDASYVPFDDSAALVRAIRRRSPAAWRRPEIAEAARKNAERFTRRAALERLAQLVEQVAGGAPPGRRPW